MSDDEARRAQPQTGSGTEGPRRHAKIVPPPPDYQAAIARYASGDGASPELEVFLGRLRAAASRMSRRPSGVHNEVVQHLDAAWRAALREADAYRDAGPCAFPLASSALKAGTDRLLQHEQARGKLYYLIGLGIGVLVTVVLPAVTIFLLTDQASTQIVAGVASPLPSPGGQGSTDGWRPHLFAQLVLFAGAGAIASVVTRLSTIDMSGETKNKIIMISGAGRPVLAVLFSIIVYQIIEHGLVSIGIATDGGAKEALIKVAGFLCGYSERFATDVLDRLPFAGGQGRTKAVAVSNPVPAAADAPDPKGRSQ